LEEELINFSSYFISADLQKVVKGKLVYRKPGLIVVPWCSLATNYVILRNAEIFSICFFERIFFVHENEESFEIIF
jgi:hypothetical protein